jgi:transcriptional regulator with XRE-family HTH domain
MTVPELIELAKSHSQVKSLRQLARMLDMTIMPVQRWQSGYGLPSDENMVKLARLAGFDEVDALLFLNAERATGEARLIYQKMLKNRHQKAAESTLNAW